MRKWIASILYFLFKNIISKESSRTDSVLAVYGHNTSAKSFEAIIEWLLRNDYHFINQQELYDYLNGINLEKKKNVWLSFDDGWKSNYDFILPLLKKYGIPATIFVSTKGIEDGYFWFNVASKNRNSSYYHELQDLWVMPNTERVKIINNLPVLDPSRLTMNKEELAEMMKSNLVSLGNHTHDHVICTTCTTEELKKEIETCQQLIKEWTGTDPNFVFSYPNGNRDMKSERVIKQMGFKLAVTTNIGRVFPDTDRFSIPRNEIKNNGILEENILQIFGLWTPFFNRLKQVFNIKNKK